MHTLHQQTGKRMVVLVDEYRGTSGALINMLALMPPVDTTAIENDYRPEGPRPDRPQGLRQKVRP